jgi:hypothetical protein
MFKKIGFVSLREISQVTYAFESAIHKRPKQSEFIDQRLFLDASKRVRFEIDSDHSERLWHFLERVSRAVILCETGELVDASPELFEYSDPFSTRGTYVDLKVGTVGSAEMDQSEEPEDKRVASQSERESFRVQNMQKLFGPFLHCPILIGSEEFAIFCNNVWQVTPTAKPFVHTDEYVMLIVAAKREDPKRSRQWMKTEICPELGSDVFRAVYAEAGKIEPMLRKSGPVARGN